MYKLLKRNKYDAVVIGAGPAGLVAAAAAAARGKVLLLSKKQCSRKKIKNNGKGRCNITNTADIQYFLTI